MTPTAAEPETLTIKLRTSLAGTDSAGRPFSAAPGDTLEVPAGMARGLADGVRAVLLDDDGNELPVEPAPAATRGRETATDKRARERETAQPPAVERDDGPTGNEVEDRKRREHLERLADGDPVDDADQSERQRRTSRGRRGGKGSSSSS